MKLLKNCLFGISLIILSPVLATVAVVFAIVYENSEEKAELQDYRIRSRYLRNVVLED